MQILKRDPGILLLLQYGNPYIRYDAGQIAENLLQLGITKEECRRIMAGEITMEGVVGRYENLGLLSPKRLRDTLLENYLRTVSRYTQKEAEQAVAKIALHRDIYLEFYDFVMNEEFPEEGAVRAGGFTARRLAADYALSPLDAYRCLIRLREDPGRTLAWLEAGK